MKKSKNLWKNIILFVNCFTVMNWKNLIIWNLWNKNFTDQVKNIKKTNLFWNFKKSFKVEYNFKAIKWFSEWILKCYFYISKFIFIWVEKFLRYFKWRLKMECWWFIFSLKYFGCSVQCMDNSNFLTFMKNEKKNIFSKCNYQKYEI